MFFSICPSTKKQYNSAVKLWWSFCQSQGHNPYISNEKTVLKFLTEKLHEGSAYGTLNTMRSAVALIIDKDLSGSLLLSQPPGITRHGMSELF